MEATLVALPINHHALNLKNKIEKKIRFQEKIDNLFKINELMSDPKNIYCGKKIESKLSEFKRYSKINEIK